MSETIIRFLRDKTGASTVEYSLIAALISVAAISALQTIGTQLGSLLSNARY